MKGVLEKFEREDFPNDGLKRLSDVIGVNTVKLILLKCPGMTFHVPKAFYKQSDINYITKHKNDTPQEIAEALGLSVRTVYRKLESIKEPF